MAHRYINRCFLIISVIILFFLTTGIDVSTSFSKKITARKSGTGRPTSTTNVPSGRYGFTGGIHTSSKVTTNTVNVPGPGFYSTGNMNQGHYLHSATLLSNGLVLIAGGYNSNGTAELYDPATGTFSFTGSLHLPYTYHTATLLGNGKVLIAGGYEYNTATYLASAELYDPSTGTFTTTGSMAQGRRHHTATLLPNGKVLIAGGYAGSSASQLASAELYDPATGTFTTTGNLNRGRNWHTATLLPNGKVLVAGGYPAPTAELYDPDTGTFTNTGSLNQGRYIHTATLLPNGKVLIASGHDFSNNNLTSAELYDPTTGAFALTGSLSEGRPYHSATLLQEGKVLIASGYDYWTSTDLSSAELYDPVTGTFTGLGNLTADRGYHTATLLSNGKVLLAGGGQQSSVLSSAELFNYASIAIPLTEVTITGPTEGTVNVVYTYTANTSPLTATLPITFTWSPEPVSGQDTATSTYRWNTAGTKTVTLSAENYAATVTDTHVISITSAPVSPISLTADSGYKSIQLEWSSTNILNMVGYQITRAISGTQTMVPIATITETYYFDEDPNLTPDTVYCYRVNALQTGENVAVSSNIACATFGLVDLWVPDVWAAPGDTAIVLVNIRNANGLQIVATDIWLDFDRSVIEPLVVSATALTEGYAWNYSINDNNGTARAIISAITSPPPVLYGDGSLFWLTFHVTSTEGMTSTLNLKEFIQGLGGSTIYTPEDVINPVPLSIEDGIFYVANNYILGDLNGNGVVQAVDAYMALQIACGKVDPTWEQLQAGDINGNGVVDAADATMILYYAAYQKWPVPNNTSQRLVVDVTKADDLVISLGNIVGAPGETIELALRAENLSDWAGGQIAIVYDPALVEEIISVEVADLAAGSALEFFDDGKGLLRIALARGDSVMGGGKLATIRLCLSSSATAGISSPLILAETQMNDLVGRDFTTSSLQRTITRVNGQVTIGQHGIYLPFIVR